MYQGCKESNRETFVIFFPFRVNEIQRCYLYGYHDYFEENVSLFFTTKVLHVGKSKRCGDIFVGSKSTIAKERQENSVLVEVDAEHVNVNQIKIDGQEKVLTRYRFLWITYDFRLFSLCEFTSTQGQEASAYSRQSYFKHLKDKINEICLKKEKRRRHLSQITNLLLVLFSTLLFKLSQWSTKLLPITKYLNIALHIDNYINAVLWAVESAKEKKKIDIKITNFLLSILMDMVLGVLFLNWLNSKVSLDSSASIFLQAAESVVNSINDLINWLRGDPAGLKLNWAFNRILATFFSFHINIWWTFLVYVKSLVQIIFQVFLKLGHCGITFQASIMADLLALVSLHVHCIHAYAAKLCSIQISSLISLWRLFLGRKKNPLRGKVDSCRYSPKQLFIGTLAFTILLFLLPTTLLYYVVFTSIILVIKIIEAILKLIQYFNQALPIYTTILWITKSPKIYGTVEIEMATQQMNGNCVLLNVKPGMCSWWDTVRYFTPECAARSHQFTLSAFLNPILTGNSLTA